MLFQRQQQEGGFCPSRLVPGRLHRTPSVIMDLNRLSSLVRSPVMNSWAISFFSVSFMAFVLGRARIRALLHQVEPEWEYRSSSSNPAVF